MIILIQTTKLAALPPMISLMNVLKALGEKFLYVGFDYPEQSELLQHIGVQFQTVPYRYYLFREHPIRNIIMKMLRPLTFYRRRRFLWRIIDEISARESDVVLWSCEMRSSALLGNRALQFGRRHISTLFELGDEEGKNWFGFDMNRFYQTATIVECEYNRAHIIAAERNLLRLPFVVPNKFYGQDTTRNLPIHDEAIRAIVDKWGARRVFLYQGSVEADRQDLAVMIDVLCKNFPECVVAVMGKGNAYLERLSEKYDNFSLVPFVAAPNHLVVTSHAHVGIAVYNSSTFGRLSPLNAVYCAPNKIYEYAGFGIPTIGNNNPGLIYSVEANILTQDCYSLLYSVEANHAGECVRNMCEAQIVAAMRKILNNYESYSSAAKAFFESVDLLGLIRAILASAREMK